MKIIEGILFTIAITLTSLFVYGIRTYVRKGRPPTNATVNATMIWFAAVVAKFIFKFSAVHFLWIFPISLVLGFLSRRATSFLSNIGWLFGRLCCIGLNEDEIRKNTLREKRFQELLKSGIKPDDARQLIIKEEKPNTRSS